MPDEKKPSPLIHRPNAPHIEQTDMLPFSIGGHTLGFRVHPDEAASTHQQYLVSGGTSELPFVLAWQRTSMHLRYHDEELKKLKDRCVALEKAVRSLGALGNYGIEVGESGDVFETGGRPPEGSTSDGN